MEIFSQGEIRKVPDNPITSLTPSTEVLKNRAGLLASFLEKKKTEENPDFSRLVRTIAMGTERIVSDMRKIIDSMEQENTEDVSLVAPDAVHDSRSQTIFLLRHAVDEIARVHAGLKSDDPKQYVEQYSKLQYTIQGTFDEMKKGHETLSAHLQELSPEVSPQSGFLAFIQGSQRVMKDALENIGKIVAVATLALSFTTLQADEVPTGWKQSVSGRITVAHESFVREGVPTSARPLFQILYTHPKKITHLPKFHERIQELRVRMKGDKEFASDTYKTDDWQRWNREIAKILIPTTKNITQDEANVVVRALQIHMKVRTPDSRFGLASKKLLLEKIPERHRASVAQVLKETPKKVSRYLEIPQVESGLVLKQVSLNDFEQKLEELMGTRYRRGISDCSGILKTAMRKLGVVDLSFDGSSTDIIHTLTTDRREVSEVRAGDFFYWKSSKNPRASHIAYVLSVLTDGIWIIDSSTDSMTTTKRFLSWEKVLRKKWAIVGTPKFLAQNVSFEKSV